MNQITNHSWPQPLRTPAPCFHGGAFFEAIGDEFDHLNRRHDIINADVLDAWFPPAPGVIATLREHLTWLIRTSPPAGCEGLLRTIARVRRLNARSLVPGSGSSDLIFRVLRHWLSSESRVLLLDPTYGEYSHVLEKVIGCHVDRFPLLREQAYSLDLEQFQKAAGARYDLVLLVNPNSPTGRHVSRSKLEPILRSVPQTTRIWIDETYVEYVGASESFEPLAAAKENIVVCKSMSKVYALSGARAAYLCAAPRIAAELRAITPPWSIGLLAQVAAVQALHEPEYYARCYAQTHELRAQLAVQLAALDLEIIPGVANFLLCHLPEKGPEASNIVARCRKRGLFLRDVGSMGWCLGRHALRIAVKDAATNQRVVKILAEVLAGKEDTVVDSPSMRSNQSDEAHFLNAKRRGRSVEKEVRASSRRLLLSQQADRQISPMGLTTDED